ncbi:MAG: hypothetical protein R3C12_14300 [Planctomycetaceae bacterium]|nr:hypothetical protein [Planctomycetaceae bacterium]
MNSMRYKVLLSYLPGMASVVNSFQSEQVQLAVFDRLISALEEKTDFVETSSTGKSSRSSSSRSSSSLDVSSAELEHELVEGESIHADLDTSI